MKRAVFVFGLALVLAGASAPAQDELPSLVAHVVDFKKLLPLLPEAPSGWTAEKPEGQTDEGLTNVHRDYKKGEGDNAPIASISIMDSASSPESIASSIEGWKINTETADGYTKPVTIDGNPGSESYEKDQKHAALRVLIGQRYYVSIELQNEDPKELQEWIKRVDLKKLAEIKS